MRQGPNLRLAPLEEYLWLDGRPSHPMFFFLRCSLRGPLERDALAHAARTVLLRHPLLNATIVKRGRQAGFQFTQSTPPEVDFRTAEAGRMYPRPIDFEIEHAPGCRLLVASAAEQHELVWQVHHAACDGRATLRLTEELLAAYARRIDPNCRIEIEPSLAPPEFTPAERDRALRRRGTFGFSRLGILGMTRQQLVGLAGVRQFLQRQPVPLVPAKEQETAADAKPVAHEKPPADYPARCGHTFTVEETAAICRLAKEAGATVNTWLLAALYPAIAAWRSERGAPLAAEDWIRLSVPIDARPPGARLPLCNYFSLVFLDRQPQQFVRAAQAGLPADLQAEMNLIRRNRLELTFPLSLAAARWLPGGLASRVEADACYATTMLSNLGRCFDASPLPRDEQNQLTAAGLTLTGMELLPPLRPNSPAVFSAQTYAGRLHVAVHYDSRVLSGEDSRNLLRGFVEAI